MDPMLRIFVLLVTHLSMLGAGVGLALITVRGRRQAVLADRAALDVRELFLETTIERQLRLRDDQADPTRAGRHRASRARPITPLTATMPVAHERPARTPSLVHASLSEAEVILATQRAQRVQDRREFVDLMTTAVGPARIRAHAIGHQYADVRMRAGVA